MNLRKNFTVRLVRSGQRNTVIRIIRCVAVSPILCAGFKSGAFLNIYFICKLCVSSRIGIRRFKSTPEITVYCVIQFCIGIGIVIL